tara:strand:+ start:505 stop:1560 length:1056 start_codon:yes stop_codon:yes gene_type:complete
MNNQENQIQPIGLIGISQLLTARAPKHLIKGFMEYNTNTVIYGESTAGKSFVALEAAFCIASAAVNGDTYFHGMHISQPGPTLYVCGEGEDGISKRIIGLQEKHDLENKEIPFYMTETGVILNDGIQLQRLLMTCEQIKAQHGMYPKLITFDTLNKSFIGNENSAEDMGELVRSMDELRRITGACVVMVHHTGKGGDIRGSSALRAGIDNQIGVFINENNDNGIVIKNDKMKDSGGMTDLFLNKRVVKVGYDDRYKEDITTLVLDLDVSLSEKKIVNNDKTKGMGKAQKEVLQVIIKESENTFDIALEELFYAIKKETGMSKKAALQSIAGLQTRGLVLASEETLVLTENK